MRRTLAVAIAVCACHASGSDKVGFVGYESPGWCFDTSIELDHGVYGVPKDMTTVVIEVGDHGYNFAVPDATAKKLVPLETYHLCAAPLHLRKDVPPEPDVIEIWKGPTLVWSDAFEFAVAQKLTWTTDRRELVVELGREMDKMWAVPFHGVGNVRVVVPDELRGKPLDDDRTYQVVVRLDLHEAGAQVTLVELDTGAGQAVWATTGPRVIRRPGE
jgi:hypothetical protein